jgi:hypothetical protein
MMATRQHTYPYASIYGTGGELSDTAGVSGSIILS